MIEGGSERKRERAKLSLRRRMITCDNRAYISPLDVRKNNNQG